MDPQTQEKAEARFEAALAETGARDPREFYREMLRELKTRSDEEYRSAVETYRSSVIEPIAAGKADPLVGWLSFGLTLAERLHPGRAVRVDRSGRAEPYAAPPSWNELILHLPDEPRSRAVPIGLPPELTDAQRAAVDLLVIGKLKAPGT